eukprot:CAMPEP_0181447430 /NCGR_PEP_ID=MMETSP1110-20121109/26618_1 /TAXON_ID=174948 /ORGANISM="Symbiodinium sp., Strain CCMP421" /LENGTH=360 /DNA_ID=CAMNT_0023571543 /DNA_START=80 /DNA_END=1162 /DNA_ORIENTATION=+
MARLAYFLAPLSVSGHGTLTWPPNRVNGSMANAGSCAWDDCIWYTDFVEIPGEPTVNDEEFRTFNVKVASGARDFTRKNPWRAPGTAPVLGRGCGIYGGKQDFVEDSSGDLLGIHPPGTDGVDLPAQEPTQWALGSVQEVAWAIAANHGGGYSYRLCPKGGNVSEECFQQHVLKFAGDKQWLIYGNVTQMGESIASEMPRLELPLIRVTEGTFPEGSEWARNPIPSCDMFSQADCEGLPQKQYISCAQAASGYDVVTCPPGSIQFPEPYPGLSGHVPWWRSGLAPMTPQWSTHLMGGSAGLPPISRGFPFSVADLVQVPPDLEVGEYLLSWRWDCEQSTQVWQNCADIQIVSAEGGTILP